MSVLRGMTWEHARGYDSVVAASRVYASLHEDVSIHWDQRSLQSFGDYPLADLVESYDLLVIDHPHVPNAAEQGLLAPLDTPETEDAITLLAAQSVGRSHDSYRYGGRQWGLASDAAAQVSAHRPDLIAEPPSSWDEVLELAGEGRVLWPAKPIDALSSAVTIAGSLGATPAAEPGVFLPEEQFAAVLDVMHRLADAVPAENLHQNPIDVANALASSERACYAPLLFGYSNYSRAGFRRHRLRYRDVPSGPAGIRGSLLGGAGIAVSVRSAHVQTATRFALWLAGAEAQAGAYFDAGGQPGNAAAWDDDRLNDETEDFFRGTRRTLEEAFVRPGRPGYLTFQDEAAPLITATLERRISDDQAFRAIAARARDLL